MRAKYLLFKMCHSTIEMTAARMHCWLAPSKCKIQPNLIRILPSCIGSRARKWISIVLATWISMATALCFIGVTSPKVKKTRTWILQIFRERLKTSEVEAAYTTTLPSRLQQRPILRSPSHQPRPFTLCLAAKIKARLLHRGLQPLRQLLRRLFRRVTKYLCQWP